MSSSTVTTELGFVVPSAVCPHCHLPDGECKYRFMSCYGEVDSSPPSRGAILNAMKGLTDERRKKYWTNGAEEIP